MRKTPPLKDLRERHRDREAQGGKPKATNPFGLSRVKTPAESVWLPIDWPRLCGLSIVVSAFPPSSTKTNKHVQNAGPSGPACRGQAKVTAATRVK